MCSKNIDKFNAFTLYTLVKLFEEFPVPIKVDAAWIAAANLFYSESESAKSANNKMDLAQHCMTWLKEEGFISFVKTGNEDVFLEVRLTLKGLTLLGYSMLKDDKTTLIDQAKNIINDATKEGAKDAIKNTLTKLLTAAVPLPI